MATLDQVEKLRERMNVSYEDAKAALEACDDDMLDAIIYLEKQGKKSNASGGSYSTKDHKKTTDGGYEQSSHTTHTTYSNNGDSVNRFFSWLGRLVSKGNRNYFQVINNDKIVLALPITVMVLLLIFCFWVVIPAMFICLLCGIRFRFAGAEVEGTKANDFMDSASKVADDIKDEFREEVKEDPYKPSSEEDSQPDEGEPKDKPENEQDEDPTE